MISDSQRENLKKLVRFLESLPEDYEGLRMYRWASKGKDAAYATPEHPCGSSACLVGYGPSAGIPFLPNEFRANGFPIWKRYAKRAFISEQDGLAFVVGSDWPDLIVEGIARIKLVLADKVPADWDYSNRFCKGDPNLN